MMNKNIKDKKPTSRGNQKHVGVHERQSGKYRLSMVERICGKDRLLVWNGIWME